MKVLVFLEQREGKLKSAALEALSTAARMSGGDPGKVAGVMIGSDIGSLVEQTKNHGAGKVFLCEGPEFEHYHVLNYTQAMTTAIESFSPDIVLGIASPMGRDLFPRLAARCDAGLLTDLVDLDLSSGFVGGTKPMYAGKILANVAFCGDGLKMATLRPNVFPVSENSGEANSEILPVSCSEESKLKTLEVRKGANDKLDLTEASRIVSGGRALGSEENFSILQDLGQTLQATVGASRAAVDSGYASHDMQVGQTGKTVNPSLYIACGISGSIQHMAGMRTSKVIVAINTDPDAPIFTVADYGLIGDLFELVPKLNAKLKELLA